MDFLTAPRAELIRLIYDLIDENKALKIQIVELRARVDKQRPKEQEKQIPPFVKPNIKTKDKKKRKNRNLGFGRVRATPTKHVLHSFEVCPNCSSPLGKPSVAYTREVIDIPLPTVEVIEHIVFKRWCTSCGKRWYPKVNLSGITVGKQRFGVNVMSLVDNLRERFLQPLNKIQQYLKTVYQLELSEGALVDMLQRTAALGKSDYEDIGNRLKASDVVYADETGGRENGKNGYTWSFSNTKYQLLLYQRSRKKEIVKEVLGSEEDEDCFQGVLVTDFLASYNEYQGFHQRCWVHLDRDMDELVEQYPEDRGLKSWVERTKAIWAKAKDYPGPSPNLPLGLQAQERIEEEDYFKDKLRKLCEQYVLQDVPQSTLCSRIITHLSELFVFVRFPNIESSNNRAERALRHTVVARKISGGTRSPKGSETRAILGSLFGTWRLQGLNPLEQTRLLLARALCQEK